MPIKYRVLSLWWAQVLDTDLAYQFSGPYVQAFVTAVQNQLDKNQWIIDYIATLSIDTADDTRIMTIGGIIGMPWPSAPSSAFDEAGFTFGVAAAFPLIDTAHGFAPHDGSYGGLFSSVFPTVGNLIPISAYRQLLKAVAKLKHDGLTLVTIDGICQLFGNNYTITFGPGVNDSDIYITWTLITAGNLWLLQTIFDKFTTAPQVFIQEV